MPIKNYLEVLKEYIKSQNMRQSKIREQVLAFFISLGRHFTVEEFYQEVKGKLPEIGIATIYRSLDLFCKAGICKEMHLDGAVTKYELFLFHEDHDHLICVKCGKFVEITSPKLTALQKRIAEENGFKFERNRLNIYGTCKKCQDSKKS